MMWAQMEGVQPRNELEIIERKGEKLIQLGPVLERFENEALDPAIERTFNIMNRAGPPAAAAARAPRPAREDRVRLDARPGAEGRDDDRPRAVRRFVGRVSGLNPEVADNVDFDEMAQQYADYTGISVKVVRPYAKVLQMRQQRAKPQASSRRSRRWPPPSRARRCCPRPTSAAGSNALESMVSA
jgi:hypothetical protein